MSSQRSLPLSFSHFRHTRQKRARTPSIRGTVLLALVCFACLVSLPAFSLLHTWCAFLVSLRSSTASRVFQLPVGHIAVQRAIASRATSARWLPNLEPPLSRADLGRASWSLLHTMVRVPARVVPFCAPSVYQRTRGTIARAQAAKFPESADLEQQQYASNLFLSM